jgi:hypothetical protein
LFLQFWPCIFLWWLEDQQMHHSFNVLVLNILLHVSAFQNANIRDSRYEHAEMVPNVGKCRRPMLQYVIYSPSFSAFHDTGHHLSMFIPDTLMTTFWNSETCRSILSTNTMNEWCICWSFTDHFIALLITKFNLYHPLNKISNISLRTTGCSLSSSAQRRSNQGHGDGPYGY